LVYGKNTGNPYKYNLTGENHGFLKIFHYYPLFMDMIPANKRESINPLMWEKQCHKPPLTGNGKPTTNKMVMTGGWFVIVVPLIVI